MNEFLQSKYTCGTSTQIKIYNTPLGILATCFVPSQSPCPLSKGNHYSDFCHHRLILPIFGLYIKVITYYAIFCVHHLLRNILSRRVTHAAAWCDSLSLWLPCSIPFHGLYHNLFIHSTVDRYLFPVWDCYKKCCYEHSCTCLLVHTLSSFVGSMPRNGIAYVQLSWTLLKSFHVFVPIYTPLLLTEGECSSYYSHQHFV